MTSNPPALSGPERDAEIDRLGREHTPAEWRRQDDAYRAEHLDIAAAARLDDQPKPERSVIGAFFGRPRDSHGRSR